MGPVLGDLGACASTVALHASKVVVGSSRQGELLEFGRSLQPDYFTQHIRNIVDLYGVLQ